ncbi:cobyric acid synthase [Halobacterium jilantaiense]|uniref:Probable cobyric acid synthase n=1 Tax=Halobacterium jilantaiense TaxID=355548 RepID=A0A1I0QMK7_9EURY|nr:cobyric acid synthase [Halobacterium jilantaiense]SEW28387.1 adenosylcobyric acid synthase (glutamine-hydrolysing) [Halobacterium jilantaiense]
MTTDGADGSDREEERAADCRTVLVAGTASHVGKSTVAAGLCRHLADRGVAVAPFKAQNMSNNARAVPVAAGADRDAAWGEIGVSQYVQARAARTPASTDHNPVLLKPRGDAESQVVLDGQAVGHYAAGDYYDEHWADARETAVAAHERLADANDVVVAEGAGSIAEINLQDRDLANLEVARFADAAILLVVDIERGGAFASLYGTLELLPGDVRDRVAGAVVTKFRGDPGLLEPGIAEIEERTGVPILGVLPYDDPGLPEEDSVSLPDGETEATRGTDDGVPDARSVTVAVPRLSRISNATDLEPLARTPGVRVSYVPPDGSLAGADAVVLPGTKNTVDDLRELRAAGFGDELRAFDGPVVGLCGGYQLLGERITNADRESTGDVETVEGVGLLPVESDFRADKRVEAVSRTLDACEALGDATGGVSGYEIHAGRTRVPDDLPNPVGPTSAAVDRVLGTYLHGLFENDAAREGFVDAVFAHANRGRPAAGVDPGSPYDAAAALVREHVDLAALGLPG